ncbi:MAG: DUF2642 domain-containing protein [Bacillota bacterium]|jgi:spore coat protein B
MSNLDCFVGKYVQIHKTGPGSIWGIVLDVKSDYIVIKSTTDEIIYINLYHIHKIIEDNSRDSSSSDNKMEFIKASSFSSLLQILTGQRICFNDGPEGFTGIIKEANQDFLKCEVNGKIYYVFIFHIRFIKMTVSIQESNKENNESAPVNIETEKVTSSEPEKTGALSKLIKLLKNLSNI